MTNTCGLGIKRENSKDVFCILVCIELALSFFNFKCFLVADMCSYRDVVAHLKIIIIEYHWIYRFVVQDESIRLMDESCGYIEQVDDKTVFGFVLGRDLRGNSTTARRKEKERESHSMRRHNRPRGSRRRQSSQKDEFGFDSNILKDGFSNNRSLLDEQDDEEDPSAINIGSYINPENKNADYNHCHDEKSTKQLDKNGVI